MRIIECHEEKIHLAGQVQDLGFLLVFQDRCCVAASDNARIEGWESSSLVGNSLADILKSLLPGYSVEQVEKNIQDKIFYRFVERIRLAQHDYFLSIYQYDGKIYLETELAHPEQIKTTKLYYYAKYIEDQSRIGTWQSLTDLVREIIGFDRVMVYKFLEDEGGQVIAESKRDDIESFLGYRYPEFDIPRQARELYKVFHARHTADVDAPVHGLIGLSKESVDLSRCSIRAMSPLHLQYIRNSGAKASASFSIIIDGELWGLVTCQHYHPRHVDLSQRHLCVFLTQYAVNNYLAGKQKEMLAFQDTIGHMETELKTELLVNRGRFTILEKFGSQIMDIMSADGVIIRHDQGFKQYGDVPSPEQILQMDHTIGESGYEAIYSTHQFRMDGENEESGKAGIFPGVVRLDVIPSSNWYIYVFRKERIVDEIWAGKPVKIQEVDNVNGVSFYSPRTSFDAWIKTTEGKSEEWKLSEIQFLKDIGQIVQQSIAQRGGEIEELNKELVRSNNALETFSYTLMHDLKNPLTSIQLSAQLIAGKKNLSEEMKLKMAANIIEGSKLITEMMDKVYKISKVTQVEFEFEMIDPESKILGIIENAMQQYQVPNLKFTVKNCIPIWGERTLLYQLFLNLVGNAIKYSSKEAQPAIEVYSEYENDEICYTITDNGIGMDLSDNLNIFEIFKRLPNTDGFEGSGIGLSIVKRIADKLNASVSVESEPGQGTTFTIRFKKMSDQ